MKIILVTLLLIAISIGLAATVDSIGTLNFRGPFFIPNTRPEISRFVWFSIEMHGLINSNEQRLLVQNNQNWINSIPQHTQTYLQNGWYLYEIKVFWSPNTTINNRESRFSVYLQNIEDGIWYNYLHVHSDYVFQFAQSQTCQYLQDSIDNAPDNSTIEIQYGNYYGSVVIDGRRGLTLIGEQNNGENPNLIGVGYESIITITNSDDITVRNLNIRNGHNDIGAGVYIEGLPVSDPDYPSITNFNNCVISNNRAIDLFSGGMPIYNSTGGALNILQAEVSIYSSILHSNRAYLWPTAHIQDGSMCFESTTIDQTDESVGIGGNTTQLQSFINCAVAFPNDSYNYIYDFSCLYHTELTSQYFEGFANFIDDPMFVDPSDANYALLKGSPCIGSGYNPDYDSPLVGGYDQKLRTVLDETRDIGAVDYAWDRYGFYEFTDDAQGNWMCFPVIDDYSEIVYGGDSITTDVVGAFFFQYLSQPSDMTSVSYRWYDNGVFSTIVHAPNNPIFDDDMRGFLGYVALFNTGSRMPASGYLHGYHIPYEADVLVPEANVENWIGYFVPQTQSPQDAFGDYLADLYYIQHKDWTMARIKAQPGAAWLISGSPTISYGEMVKVKRFTSGSDYFNWTCLQESQRHLIPEPEFFNFDKQPEYTAIFVELDSTSTFSELAVICEGECYGAAVVEENLGLSFKSSGSPQKKELRGTAQ